MPFDEIVINIQSCHCHHCQLCVSSGFGQATTTTTESSSGSGGFGGLFGGGSGGGVFGLGAKPSDCLLYTSPSPRDRLVSRMPSSA